MKRPALNLEPKPNILFVLRANRANQQPEAFRMIHMDQVADLVCNHIIDDAVGREHNEPVVLQHPLRGAVPPLRLGFA